MTKAALCVACSDIVSPLRDWQGDRSWRWCQCGHAGVRWRDGDRGLLEVTSLYGPASVRVLGLSNSFLIMAVADPPSDAEAWRDLHATCAAEVDPHYLFHASRRACWALVIRPGETGDVTFVPYADLGSP